jgi:hypothetical protein
MSSYFDIASRSLFGHILAPVLVVLIIGIVTVQVEQARRTRDRERARALAAGDEPPSELPIWPWTKALLGAVGMAAFYLVAFRGISLLPVYHRDNSGGAILMSFAFLFMGPFIAGVITVAQGTRQEPWPVSTWIFAPWIPIILNILLALAVFWEGIICVIFILPPALISASLGGVLAGALQRHLHNKAARNIMFCLSALPLLLAMVEVKLNQPLQTRTVDTSIVIHASLPKVWQNIERVSAIRPSELRRSWANAIGFPRPVEATLSYEGIGGVRNASFERGLNFTETITDWVPNQRIAFTIKADTAAIPRTTLDEHVTVGGRFFDVLTGEYAAMWSDAVMRDMQSNILHVIRNRCEAAASQQQASTLTTDH